MNGIFNVIFTDNGNKYEGQFVKGKKEGYGTYYHIVTGQEQRGFWTNDWFINGTMSDADFRQRATRPTLYPIPEVHNNYEQIIEKFLFSL